MNIRELWAFLVIAIMGTRIALARVPMALITSPQNIEELVKGLHSALEV